MTRDAMTRDEQALNEGKEIFVGVIILLVTLCLLVSIMASCNVLIEKEVTKRQYIAGTNVLEKSVKTFP